jgi:hypothetical protein
MASVTRHLFIRAEGRVAFPLSAGERPELRTYAQRTATSEDVNSRRADDGMLSALAFFNCRLRVRDPCGSYAESLTSCDRRRLRADVS